MKTSKSEEELCRRLERWESRIKITKEFILSHTTAGLLNNHKWYEIFNWLDSHRQSFNFKTLLSDDIIRCDSILELEKIALLLDNSGDFIDFLEIDFLVLHKTERLTEMLDSLSVNFIAEQEQIKIQAYRR